MTLCIACSTRPPMQHRPGLVVCAECHAREGSPAHRVAAETWRAARWCVKCSAPVPEGACDHCNDPTWKDTRHEHDQRL